MPPETAVLILLGGKAPPHDGLDWAAIAAIAREHRLEPLLAGLWAEAPPSGCPPETLATWQAAARAAALTALAQRRAMLHLARELDNGGPPPLFLKGGWFAWHAYSRPAERPSRDLDILLPPHRARSGWERLCGQGFVPDPGAPAPDALERSFHHLPPLTHPDWGRVEIHLRLWSPATPVPGVPREPDDAWADHVVDADGIASPAPPIMLAHLAVHTMHAGAMDAGPLALTDCDRMCAVAGFDWDRIWKVAAEAGWLRAAALLLTITDRHVRPGLLARSRCPVDAPEVLVEAAPRLLCQPLDKRDRLVMLGAAQHPGLAQARPVAGSRDWRPHATAARAVRFAGALLDSNSRKRAGSAVLLDRWLKGI